MIEVQGKSLVEACKILGQLSIAVHDPNVKTFDTVTIAYISGCIDNLIVELKSMNMIFTGKAILRLRESLNTDGITVAQCRQYLDQTQDRLTDEIQEVTLLAISVEMRDLYNPLTPPFGQAVFDAFPSANEDISESAKCLSLGRATAAVMHLMRVLEVGLKVTASAIGVGDQSNWGAYIKEIDKKIKAMSVSNGDSAATIQFFSEASANFDHVRLAWRNSTMHVERTYTTERALEIFGASKSFMGHLSERVNK